MDPHQQVGRFSSGMEELPHPDRRVGGFADGLADPATEMRIGCFSDGQRRSAFHPYAELRGSFAEGMRQSLGEPSPTNLSSVQEAAL